MPSRAGARSLDSIHIARIARTLDTHARNDPTAYVTYVPAAARAMDARRRERRRKTKCAARWRPTDRPRPAMGWVKTPPSASARDAHVVPLGATKTLYLIRHAEGFHNQGASTRADDEKIIDLMS